MARRSLREITSPGPEVRWSVTEALGVVLAAHVVLILVGSLLVGTAPADGEVIPIPRQFLATSPFWLAAIALSWWLAGRDGEPATALGFRLRPVDVPIGLAIGVALQLAVIPGLYRLFGADLDELERPARALADAASGPLATVLFVLMTCVFAPLAEEILYRGLLQRGASRRSAAVGVAVAALVFGAAHFQLLQLPGLVLFGATAGVAVWWTGRLGVGIVAHVAFNASTVVLLLARR